MQVSYCVDITNTCYLAILPIELLRFQAHNNSNHNSISWMTATESNNSHFIVEKSNDGLTFSALTEIKGNGTTSKSNYYSAVDNTPYAITYYRLTSVDFDDTKHLSQIITVKSEQLQKWIEITTSNNEEIKLQVTDNQKDIIKIEVFDLTGKLVIETILRNGNSSQSINISSLNQGMYILNASNERSVFSQKFLKE